MTINALINFVDGDSITAQTTNDNNQFLLSKITQNGADALQYIETRISGINSMLQSMFPVGSIYLSVTDTCPLAGLFGTWEKVSSGRVLQGSDETNAAGNTIEAGLPNITGSTGAMYGEGGLPVSGAFTTVKGSYTGCTSGSGWRKADHTLNLDASDSSSIYGNSETVQPPAYVVNIWKRTA